MNRKDYYNKKAELYRTNSSREERILSLLPAGVQNILDIGCGRGNLARVLVQKGYRVSGADISDEGLAGLEDVLENSFCFNVEDETWPSDLTDKKFDLIIASEIIEHIFNPDHFLAQARGLLNPEGYMIITTPNFLFWKNRFKMFFGKFAYEDKGLLDFGHVRFFTYATTRKIFLKHHLSILKENHIYPNLDHRGLNFLGRIFPGFFAYQMIFLLKK